MRWGATTLSRLTLGGIVGGGAVASLLVSLALALMHRLDSWRDTSEI
jgi:hypothetical protein